MSKFTESLTRENAAVVFVDHQVGLYSGVRDIALAELKHNVVALAKAARVLQPAATPRKSLWLGFFRGGCSVAVGAPPV
jgi:hypothetical protein